MFSAKDLFFTPASSGAYQIPKSLRFRSGSYLSRTFGTPTSNTTWTFSCWLKRGGFADKGIFGETTGYAGIYFSAADKLRVMKNDGSIGIETTAVYRDPSAWAHVVVRSNGTDVKAYWNSVEVGSYTGTITLLNSAVAHYLGKHSTVSLDGYLAEVNFIDGQALLPASFGAPDATTGVWNPIAYTGTYGTNGFYLKFTDNSAATSTTIGKDYSGNSNNWTPNNISLTSGATYDSMLDSPTPYASSATGVGNYCVLNPLDKNTSTTLTEANLSNYASSAAWQGARATFGINTGKWYIEGNITNHGTAYAIGFANSAWTLGQTAGDANASGIYWDGSGTNYYWFTTTVTSAGFTPANGNSFLMAIDMDAGKVWFGYRTSTTTWLGGGDPSAGTSPTFTFTPNITLWPCISTYNTTQRISINFGQRPYSASVPSGFKALNTSNLPTPTIANGAQYMAAVTYSGTSASQPIYPGASGVSYGNNPLNTSFQPDLVWIKARTATTSHKLTDSTRGVTKAISTDSTAAESTDANGVTSFTPSGATGFTVGSDANYNNGTGPITYIAWEWKKSVSAGFDIVSYAGNNTSNQNISHSLNVAPVFVWVKSLSTGSFYIWHQNLTSSTYFLKCNSTDGTNAQTNTNTPWGTANWSSTQFMVTNNATNNLNASATNYISYLFAPVAGFSAFGSYAGNGLADGPFVYLGFRPRWIMFKVTSTTGDWIIYDTSRDTYNYMQSQLYPDLSAAEAAGAQFDILSNGFKLRTTGTGINASSATYIYAAFCEVPFNFSRAR